MPIKAIKVKPVSMAQPVTHDPFLKLALIVIRSAVQDKDWGWFHSEDYRFWLGYVQVSRPGELYGDVLPTRVRARK